MSRKISKTYTDITIDLTNMDSVNFYDKSYSDCINVKIFATKGNHVIHYIFHIPHNKNNLDDWQN